LNLSNKKTLIIVIFCIGLIAFATGWTLGLSYGTMTTLEYGYGLAVKLADNGGLEINQGLLMDMVMRYGGHLPDYTKYKNITN